MFRFDKYVNIVHHVEKVLCNIAVTPFVGVWIEIVIQKKERMIKDVTPFVGVWIEIIYVFCRTKIAVVTPFVGVWIEIE